MPIQLFSNLNTLLDHLPADDGEHLRVVLTGPDGEMAEDLAIEDPGLLMVDITGPKLQRVNFDLVRFAVIDLAPKTLLASGGRRLMDVLGHLALEDLTLAFVGPATAVTGGILEDGVTAGLNLLPRTAVLADVQAVADLRGLLTALSHAGRRILALDGAVAATYTRPGETVTVTGHGSVLLVAFHQEQGAETPTARINVLGAGMTRTWPDHSGS